MAKSSTGSPKAPGASPSATKTTGGGLRFWLLLQGTQLSIVESNDRPDNVVSEGEATILFQGVYASRELAMDRAAQLMELQLSAQKKEVI